MIRMKHPRLTMTIGSAGSQDTARVQRVLMLCHRVPYPLDRGDRIRAYHILEHLSRRFEVSLACTSDEPVGRDSLRELYKLTDQVAVQRVNPLWSKLRGVASLATGGAITPACFYRRGLAKTILQWHDAEPFDAVLTFCTGMIHYARQLTSFDRVTKPCLDPRELARPALRHVIDLVDVDSAKWLDYARHSKAPMRWVYRAEAKRLRRIEAGCEDYFDGVAVVSRAEADIYRREVGDHPGLKVVRHAVDLDYFKPMPDGAGKNTLVFVGVLNYRPNVEGITWFVDNVMPQLLKRIDGVTLKIVGRHPTAQVSALGSRPGVEVVGPVADVRRYLCDATAVVAPLQIARGVQTKVLEAMASGRVVVCSRGAAEGIEGRDGDHFLVADTAQQWVDQLERVLTQPQLRACVALRARAQVERVYPWEKCLEPLTGLLSGSGGVSAVALDETLTLPERGLDIPEAA